MEYHLPARNNHIELSMSKKYNLIVLKPPRLLGILGAEASVILINIKDKDKTSHILLS